MKPNLKLWSFPGLSLKIGDLMKSRMSYDDTETIFKSPIFSDSPCDSP